MTDPFHSTSDAEFHRALLELPIVRIDTSAPTRIDLAGGTIDIWPLYLLHEGAQTINVAISLRAAARVEDRDDGRVHVGGRYAHRDVVGYLESLHRPGAPAPHPLRRSRRVV